ncbi:MAG: M1 family metallopeptidase [Bacteroidota bacterium]
MIVAQPAIYDSGGPLSPEQAAYDVSFYDLQLRVDPKAKHIEGTLTMDARIVHPTDQLVLNLDTLLSVYRIREETGANHRQSTFVHQKGWINIDLQTTRQAGEWVRLQIDYGGQPRVAPRPPWNGGFTWKTTPSGAPWIATTCQQEGADLWWPNKDHVSDKPDSMALHIRVPQPLVVATNGRLRQVEEHADGERTYHWLISTPISNYNIALNIAPYEVLETDMQSIDGTNFPVFFYVLPEDREKGKQLLPEILTHLQFYEQLLGPYPFRQDKYGVAQTPHLGMEHQSIIAYGANFDNSSMSGKNWGFDALHHHELAHEWWGNLVTNHDWRDMWLHEGFGTYMQALYVEQLQGAQQYQAYMAGMRRFANLNAVAPRASQTAKSIYKAPIYAKGAWILHSLRFVMGDEAFFTALRRMAYPDPALENVKDGRQVRFATTDDFLYLAEQASQQDLDWFFELYLRQAKLPVLHYQRSDDELKIHWETPNNLPFPMPIEISINQQLKSYAVPASGLRIPITPATEFLIDPHQWVLKEYGK